MNAVEHLLTCLGEEGAEIAQDCSKCNRFGLKDRNVLNPTGATNRDRLVVEMNQLFAVAEMLVDVGALPADWFDSFYARAARKLKKDKVLEIMDYARKVGALKD